MYFNVEDHILKAKLNYLHKLTQTLKALCKYGLPNKSFVILVLDPNLKY